MTRDALSPQTGLTGLILGAATVLLAVSAFGLTRSTPRAQPQPEYACRYPMGAFSQPPTPSPESAPMPLITNEPLPGRLPTSCHRYIVSVRQFASSNCPPLPKTGRQALLDAVHQMETAWRDIPESAMPALSDACRSANEALDQALVNLCPQL